MKRTVTYRWRLAELMARDGMHNSTNLAAHLRERDITLSSSQIYRLATQRPERVSLQLIAALCDIFQCGPDDLSTVTAADQRTRKKTGTENVIDLDRTVRPTRARVLRDDD